MLMCKNLKISNALLLCFFALFFNEGLIETEAQNLGERCMLKSERVGICKHFGECQSALLSAKKGIKPERCDTTDNQAIVCCEDRSETRTEEEPTRIRHNTEEPIEDRRIRKFKQRQEIESPFDVQRVYQLDTEDYYERRKHIVGGQLRPDFSEEYDPDRWKYQGRPYRNEYVPQQEDVRQNPQRKYQTSQEEKKRKPWKEHEYPEKRPTQGYEEVKDYTRRYERPNYDRETTKSYDRPYYNSQTTTNRYDRSTTQRWNNEKTTESYVWFTESKTTPKRPGWSDVQGWGTTKRKEWSSAEGNKWPTEENLADEYDRRTTTTRRSYTTRSPYHSTTRREYYTPDHKPISNHQPTRRPQSERKRISEIKCNEYAQVVTETIAGLPLTADPKPVEINIHKCIYPQKLIVGGENTTVGEFPHMAAVGFRDDDGAIAWSCGGSLISEEFVLTAAHCTSTRYGPPVLVRLGEYNLKSNDDGAHPVDYYIKEIIKHPEYRPPSKYHDIALLRLARRVTFIQNIRPACLHSKESFPTKKTIATGWGQIDYAEDPSEVLLKVVLSIIDNHTCNRLYGNNGKTEALARGIIDGQMCAGELEGGRDTCQGDSGGPIGITSKSNRCIHHIIGITSFGKHCAQPNAPGVYTRVSRYVPWIESVVWRQ